MDRVAKAGSLICVDEGKYSDYEVVGFFVVLRDFFPFQELKLYLQMHPKEKSENEFNTAQFLAFLLAQGFLVEIQYETLHLGSYGCNSRVNFSSWQPRPNEE